MIKKTILAKNSGRKASMDFLKALKQVLGTNFIQRMAQKKKPKVFSFSKPIKTNVIGLSVTKTSPEIPDHFLHSVHHLVNNFSRREKLLSKFLQQNPFRILLHGVETPKFGFGHAKTDPVNKVIHVFHNPTLDMNVLGPHLHDSLIRSGFATLVGHVVNGQKNLKKKLPKITADKPLKGKEVQDKASKEINRQIKQLEELHKSMLDMQNAAYEEEHLHHKKLRNKLKSSRKEQQAGKLAAGTHAIMISHFKRLLSGQTGNKPADMIITRMIKTSKTPKTTAAFGRFHDLASKML